jgi:t-SNARE complex subunit (syntaxin)
MTARSKNRRERNRKLKSQTNARRKELKRLAKITADGGNLMEICSEVVDEKKLEEIKQVNSISSLTGSRPF